MGGAEVAAPSRLVESREVYFSLREGTFSATTLLPWGQCHSNPYSGNAPTESRRILQRQLQQYKYESK